MHNVVLLELDMLAGNACWKHDVRVANTLHHVSCARPPFLGPLLQAQLLFATLSAMSHVFL